MTEKFKVGDRVYDILYGEVHELQYIEDGYEAFKVGLIRVLKDGKTDVKHKYPRFISLEQARAKGYDVPKEKIKKTQTQYCLVFRNGVISGQRFKSRASAEEHTREYDMVIAIAECVFTWEEEI